MPDDLLDITAKLIKQGSVHARLGSEIDSLIENADVAILAAQQCELGVMLARMERFGHDFHDTLADIVMCAPDAVETATEYLYAVEAEILRLLIETCKCR